MNKVYPIYKTSVHWLTLLLMISLTTSTANAEAVSWRVQPKVCIVENLGDVCEMELNILAVGLSKGQYCYYQNDTLLLCKVLSQSGDTVRVRFSEFTTLQLRNLAGEIILSHEMQIKARTVKKRTRRVRQPWSLF